MQSDVARRNRLALLEREVVAIEDLGQIGAELTLHAAVSVEVEQKFLHLIQAHRQAPQCGIGCEPRLTQTFFGSRNTS